MELGCDQEDDGVQVLYHLVQMEIMMSINIEVMTMLTCKRIYKSCSIWGNTENAMKQRDT